MFVQLVIREKCEYDTKDGEAVDTLCEPWLSYSDPIKFSDNVDERAGTISIKLALLYILSGDTGIPWIISENLGSSLNYAAKTKAGEAFVPIMHRA